MSLGRNWNRSPGIWRYWPHCLAARGLTPFREELPDALNAGVTPVMVKEIVYQAVDYLGIGRVLPFLEAANEILTQRGVSLPLEGQATTTMENRLEKGAQAQADIFALRCWRPGRPVISTAGWRPTALGITIPAPALTLPQREMITFCFLAAQGGCEPQLTSHARGNMNLGNDKAFLIRVVSSACLTSAIPAA